VDFPSKSAAKARKKDLPGVYERPWEIPMSYFQSLRVERERCIS